MMRTVQTYQVCLGQAGPAANLILRRAIQGIRLCLKMLTYLAYFP